MICKDQCGDRQTDPSKIKKYSELKVKKNSKIKHSLYTILIYLDPSQILKHLDLDIERAEPKYTSKTKQLAPTF